MFDDDGWYVTLDPNARRIDPLSPVDQFFHEPPHLADELPPWSKFVLFVWVLAGLPIGIAAARRFGKIKRKKLLTVALFAYAFSISVAITNLSEHFGIMRNVAAKVW